MRHSSLMCKKEHYLGEPKNEKYTDEMLHKMFVFFFALEYTLNANLKKIRIVSASSNDMLE